MATKTARKKPIKSEKFNLKSQVKQINNGMVEVAEELLDASISTGEQWQDLLAKSVKGGTEIVAKQQDIVFDTLDMFKGMYVTGNKRLLKLFKIKVKERKANKPKNSVTPTKVTAKKASAIVEKAKTAVKKTTTKAAVKKTTIKAASKISTKGTTSTKNDDFKVISGIGPKMNEVLHTNGIKTYKQLATAKVNDLKKILEKAGPTYRLADTSTWAKQAKFASVGKWEELKAFNAKK